MPVTITDWGIEHNGVKKYNGTFVAGPGSGFKIWAIADVQSGTTSQVQLKTVAQTSGEVSKLFNPADATSSATDSNFAYVRGTTALVCANYNMAPITGLPANANVKAIHLHYKITPNGKFRIFFKLYSNSNHSSYTTGDAVAWIEINEDRSTYTSTTALTKDLVLDHSSPIVQAVNSDHSLITTEGKCVFEIAVNNGRVGTGNTRQILWFCYMWVDYE